MNERQRRDIGAQVKAAREAKGMTQAEVALKAGLGSSNTVGSIEHGREVKAGSLRKVLDALGVEPVAQTLRREGYPQDVELVLDVLGMYLMAKPADERPQVAHALVAWLMAREKSSGSGE